MLHAELPEVPVTRLRMLLEELDVHERNATHRTCRTQEA